MIEQIHVAPPFGWFIVLVMLFTIWITSDWYSMMQWLSEVRRHHAENRQIEEMLRQHRRLARVAPNPKPSRPCPPGCHCRIKQRAQEEGQAPAQA